VRLHLVSFATNSLFDIALQGNVVEADVNPHTQAGGLWRGLIKEFDVTVAGQEGLSLEFIRRNINQSAGGLAAIEILTVNVDGSASPTVDVDISTDNGDSWTTIAQELPVDRYGSGSLQWLVPEQFVAAQSTAMIRIRHASVQGVTPDAFLIAPAGQAFYVNMADDPNLSDNQYTTAVGQNTNSGRSPDAPVSSIAALLSTYTLGTGDVIYVDTGTYHLSSNIVLDASLSGIRIQGPTDPGREAILNRVNTTVGNHVFDISGAQDVTIANLGLTGAYRGIAVLANTGSSQVTITDNDIFQNADNGVWSGQGNSHVQIIGNRVFDNYVGISLGSDQSLARGNEVYSNSVDGITAPAVAGNPVRYIEQNEVHSNGRWGISSGLSGGNGEEILITGNTVYGHQTSTGIGIYSDGGTVRDNVAYYNRIGILLVDRSPAIGNRVFGNQIGIDTAPWRGLLLESNRVYSNNTGIRLNDGNSNGDEARHVLRNNVVYANTNLAIQVNGYATVDLINNTIYQPVGDAISIQNQLGWRVSSHPNPWHSTLTNNIFWVEAGAAIRMTQQAQPYVDSDYNLMHLGPGAAAVLGRIGTQDIPTLGDWQQLTGLDSQSLVGNSQFVDINGIDNILGFVNGVDGGLDDNWSISRNSPAIDRGQSWSSFNVDMVGSDRQDDPSTTNAGGPSYQEQALALGAFEEIGVAKNWRSNNSYWQLSLPFSFPYFGASYSSVWVSSKGFLHFGSASEMTAAPSAEVLQSTKRIAPLWDNLTTLGAGNDIFVDSSEMGQVTIRWRATHLNSQSEINVAVNLDATGEFRYSFGAGNTGINPTIGYSSGQPDLFNSFHLASIHGASDLSNHPGLQYSIVPGFVDIGALEFRGDSGDQTPPTIVSSEPGVVHGQSTTGQDIEQIRLNFSEEINWFDANAYSAYDLRNSGLNGVFGDADDILYTLAPEYQLGATYVDLQIINGPLSHGSYRLTLPSTVASGIRDAAGLRLDGDNDGLQGGDYVRFFSIADIAQVVGSYVYHSGSVFDSGDISIALDTGKSLAKEEDTPQTLGFDNLINTSRGINGLVFDFQNLPGSLSTTDFVFQWSPQGAFSEQDHLPLNWLLAPSPTEITAIPGPTDRIVLQWPDNAIDRQSLVENHHTG
jgi:hypothetical protein